MKNIALKIVTFEAITLLLASVIVSYVNGVLDMPITTGVSLVWVAVFVYANCFHKKGE